MIYSSPTNYWIQPGALTFTLNALGEPDKVSVAIVSGAVIMAYVKAGGTPIIDYNAAHNYRAWTIQASPTQLDRHDKVYVYARLEKNGTDALIIYPYLKLDIYGRIASSSSTSSSSSDEEEIDPNYYYIMLGALTSSGSGTTPRTWAEGEALSYGTLDTDQQRNEQRSDDLSRMFQRDVNDVIWTQHDLTFVAGAKLLLLRMPTLTGNTTIDVTTITRSSDFSSINYGATDGSIMTSAAVAKYIELYAESLDNRFLRKDQADATSYKLTMGEAEVTGDASVGGDLGVTGDVAVGDTLTVGDELSVGGDASVSGGLDVHGNVTAYGTLKSDHFEPGIRGWRLDRNGNLEAETAHFRSAIETDELIINRQQAQEGDTIYSDNDQIEAVEAVGGSGGTTNYILTLKEKWDGYFTAQQYGNIIRGKINTLAAKEAEVWPEGVDYSTAEYASSQGVDAGGNKYYTSFMHCVATHNTNPALGVNQIEVALYGDEDVPMARNYPPCPLMAIARWGCRDYASPSDPDYETVLASIKRRQSLFMLTTTDGHIVKMTGVNQPILENWNFGTTLGTLPEFVKRWSIGSRLIDGRDYLYAQGVVVGDFIKVDIDGAPILNYVDCGEWVDGSSIAEPSIGNGIYLYAEKNDVSLQWETSDVWWKGCKWRCMQHQPVVSGGTTTYHEPGWNSSYWQFLEGDNQFRMEFASSMGYRFRMGSVNTTIVPTLYVGNEDITDEIATQYWYWTRTSDVTTAESRAADTVWNSNHTRMKTLTITDSDMPAWWSSGNRIKFVCHVTISDGRTLEFSV